MRSSQTVKNLTSDFPSHLVLDVDFEDNQLPNGGRRIVLSVNDQAFSEQWLIDVDTKMIRNHEKNLCINLNEDLQLIASPCDVTSAQQKWLYDKIRRTLHHPHYDLVAEVMLLDAEVGGVVVAHGYEDKPGQHFELGTLPLYFLLVNEETGLVLSVFEGRGRPGTQLVIASLETPPAYGQLWYLNSKEVLRLKINGFVIDSSHETFRSKPFSYETVDTTSWTFFDRQIINLKDERQAMEPAFTKDAEQQLVVLAPRRRDDEKVGQKFKIVYAYEAQI